MTIEIDLTESKEMYNREEQAGKVIELILKGMQPKSKRKLYIDMNSIYLKPTLWERVKTLSQWSIVSCNYRNGRYAIVISWKPYTFFAEIIKEIMETGYPDEKILITDNWTTGHKFLDEGGKTEVYL